ncbi:GntR family transcriptional regulator [Paraburkholderia pallida]|uniref:GntR family transcriptional regulator n=2 Tax=Paraburkholderia pallida TaxID=2547399 RepID=A0A4P7D9V0_9BURK|nr:GntR family transcriptional regulator [Paraburkholderia pallida]
MRYARIWVLPSLAAHALQLTADMSEITQLHHQVTEILRDKIVDGKLRPGTPISERELCEELGVSRTPLREALKILASEGLVQLFRNRGAIVSPISVETIEDKLAVLGALEGYAAKLICETASDEELKNLADIHRRFAKDFDSENPEEYFDLNQSFHRQLVALSRNSVLIDLHATLSKHVRRPRIEGVRQHVPTRKVIDEHAAILKALLTRDSAAAQLAAEEHMNRVAQAVVKHFRAR